MNPYDIVKELEKVIAEYAGSKFAVAVDSCTNAILLSLKYYLLHVHRKYIGIPKHTYVGVAYAILNAGKKCQFRDENWQGTYLLSGTNIVDSARRFKRGMYMKNSLYCLSCHWSKHLKIGRGGFICTDNIGAYEMLKKMRFDGRTELIKPKNDNFIHPGYHCYMLPEEAARGLMLMKSMPDDNPDLSWDDYPDLSKYSIFQKGY